MGLEHCAFRSKTATDSDLKRPAIPMPKRPVPPLYLIRATIGFFAAGGDALFTAKEERCFPETAVGFVCLPSAILLARQEVPASPRRFRWRLRRHSRTAKRNPAVFRPRAARSDDGARRPVETPRFFRCHRPEPIASRECPCPAKGGFGIGGNNRGTKKGSVSDAVHSRRSHGLGIRASRCRSGVPHTDSATGFVEP